MISSPSWWWRPGGSFMMWLLWPLSVLWSEIMRVGLRRPQRSGPCPVICVGNFTVGGAGKTPLVAYLCDFLSKQGLKPFILSRGYGGSLSEQDSFIVDVRVNTAFEVGDEPWILAQQYPVVIGSNRWRSAQVALEHGANVVILDDGLQNTTLRKDLSFALVDAKVGLGNGTVMPAGPLRASLAAQWPHISCLVIMGEGQAPSLHQLEETALARDIPILRAHVEPLARDMEAIRGKKLVAFAGLGHPDKFFDMLVREGMDLREIYPYPDHYWFTTEDLDRLAARARDLDAVLVTTHKDAARIDANAWEVRGVICVPIGIDLVWQDAEKAEAFLREKLVNL